jgi:hypothetical protein
MPKLGYFHRFTNVWDEKYGYAHIKCSCGWVSESISNAPAGFSSSWSRDVKILHLLEEIEIYDGD